MPRGRKPDAPGVQEAKGNPGKRQRKNRTAEERAAALAAATPQGAPFGPPEFLGAADFDHAIAIWRELAPELARLGILERLDRYAFAMYCVHMADWIRATRAIAKEGAHYKAKNVNGDDLWRRNPAVLTRELAEKHVLELGERFGFNPSTRFKLLRDQSLIPQTPDMFNRTGGAAESAADSEDEQADPTGLMQRLGSAPPPVTH